MRPDENRTDPNLEKSFADLGQYSLLAILK